MSSSQPYGFNFDFTANSYRSSGIIEETTHSVELTRDNITQTDEVRAELVANGFLIDREGNLTWSECHELHPRNWAVKRKLFDTGIMFAFELWATLLSNTGVCPSFTSSHNVEP